MRSKNHDPGKQTTVAARRLTRGHFAPIVRNNRLSRTTCLAKDVSVEILQLLWQLILNVFQLLGALLNLAAQWWFVIVWIAWWTFAVNWRKLRPVLSQGAWGPVILLMLIIALAWSRLAPGELSWGIVVLPNFWWQLAALTVILCFTLLCGVLQDVLGVVPPELNLEPPVSQESEHEPHPDLP